MNDECIANWLKSIKEKYIHGGDEALDATRRLAIDIAIERLRSQQAEIDRLKAEKSRVIEQIESEIHRVFKERGCVKDDVGIAQYQWLINGYQSALNMIKDGEQNE